MVKKRRFNWVVSDWIRRGLKHYFEWSARLRGERFYCRVLAGTSEYNLTINCDQTVSCSCQDYDGSGHLGDLKQQTFEQVFFGPAAQRFRQQLAEGKLPLRTCTRCADLQRVPSSTVKHDPVPRAGPEPKLPYRGVLLENTVLCNLDCLGCGRKSAVPTRSVRQMDLTTLDSMANLVRQLGLRDLFFLNLGEPFLSPNVAKELALLRGRNPDCRIVISTNGLLLQGDQKREGALHASHIFFSIPGVDDEMVRKYEQAAGFQTAYRNMKELVEFRNARGLARPLIEWKYLLFNWTDRRATILKAIELARAAGVDGISFWPTGNPFYGVSFRYRLGLLNDIGTPTWKGREVDFRPPEKAARDPLTPPAPERPAA